MQVSNISYITIYIACFSLTIGDPTSIFTCHHQALNNSAIGNQLFGLRGKET